MFSNFFSCLIVPCPVSFRFELWREVGAVNLPFKPFGLRALAISKGGPILIHRTNSQHQVEIEITLTPCMYKEIDG